LLRNLLRLAMHLIGIDANVFVNDRGIARRNRISPIRVDRT
jgi:hypothetical protein